MITIYKGLERTTMVLCPPVRKPDIEVLQWANCVFTFLLPRGTWRGWNLADQIELYVHHPKADEACRILRKHDQIHSGADDHDVTIINNGPLDKPVKVNAYADDPL